MSSEFSKTYDAKTTDQKWAAFWEEHNLFRADPHSTKPAFGVVLPPPNVTGVLHMGHALSFTLQDVIARWKRMCGFETLWVPGTDHAGIGTQIVVERHLFTTLQKRRRDFTREEFLKHVWAWKEKSEKIIVSQLKKLGCSCDWSRQRFTMDEGCNRAVRTIFKKMYDDGLIYRGKYLVNWDPITQTAIADDEVEYEQKEGSLWYFRYPLSDSSGYAVIATTRPETMLGDTAIAVSPKDMRYTHLIGKTAVQPLTGRELPIFADNHIDPEFGTGMVKITPAHDHNDYQMALRHNLEMINIFTPDAKLNEKCGEFQGMTREEARTAVVQKMKALGFLEKIETHPLRVGIAGRSRAIVEPYLSEQWFVNMQIFRPILRKAVAEGTVQLIPENWKQTYFHWIDNLRDWCISRQLWWGHRIPVWYHKQNPTQMICYEGVGEPPEVVQEPEMWVQDEDVLDTWFSSGLWPFSTLGWPDATPELKRFYPNAMLVTGHDILFFWVARMILMGEYLFDKPPFPKVYLNGLVYGKSYWRKNEDGSIAYVSPEEKESYDMGKPIPKEVHSKWEKLSKSKGNIIDPLQIIDLYGTDAMRMALCSSSTASAQIDLDRRKFEEFKNFTNKIWNGARFVLMNLEDFTTETLSQGIDRAQLALEDKWILSKFNSTIALVNKHLAQEAFDHAALAAYDFFWKEFCAYYVEIAKPVLFGKTGTAAERANKQRLLLIILSAALRLLHPMAPFITEELFALLKERFQGACAPAQADAYTQELLRALQAPACMTAPYPQAMPQEILPEVEEMFQQIEQIVYGLRNIRGVMKVPPGMSIDVTIYAPAAEPRFAQLKSNERILHALVKIHPIQWTTQQPERFPNVLMVGPFTIGVPLPKELQQQEKERLLKEQLSLQQKIETLKQQLSNAEFMQKAPAKLVEAQQQQLAQAEAQLATIAAQLSNH